MDATSVKRFHDAYITADEVGLDNLWKYVAPKRLIKFFPAQYQHDGINYSLESIMDGKLWMSSPKQFNDPFDCVINVDYRIEAEAILEQMSQLVVGPQETREIMSSSIGKRMVEEATKCMRNHMSIVDRRMEKEIYVSCFSEKSNLHSLCMWGHYANNHKGVCAEYEFKDVNNACEFGCIPVCYTDSYSLQDDYKGNGVKRILSLVYTKALEWEREREWRVSSLRNDKDERGYKTDIALPKCVYLGCKAEEKLQEDIRAFCNSNKIDLYKMRIRPGSYTLFEEKLI